jgi:ADP-ribose diphosphatase
MEEVGDGVRRLTRIVYLILAPGYSDAPTHIVLAEDLFAERRPSDAPEEVEVILWRLDRLEELIGREDFTEVRSIAALYSVRDMTHR